MNNNELYVSLDIGTSNIKVIVGEMTDDSLNIIGVGNVPSEGIKKGSIVDIDETVHSIRKAFDQAERMVGFPLRKAIVGVNGNYINIQDTNGVVAVSSENKEIHTEDVRRVMEAAQVVSIPHEQLIVDVIPRQFIVDGRDEITDPKKMLGVRLEVEGTLITGSKTILHNLLRCVERAGIEITDICLQPLAAGSAALSKDEKNLGVALIDIGGGSTTVAVFEQGHLTATHVIPLGGENITKDVSIGLRTSTEEAERVKNNLDMPTMTKPLKTKCSRSLSSGQTKNKLLLRWKWQISLRRESKRSCRSFPPSFAAWELTICPAALYSQEAKAECRGFCH